MKVQRIKIDSNEYIWLVLGDDLLPIQPIESFIRFLHLTEKSPETLQSYASHLKLYWEFLQFQGKAWQQVSTADFAEFVHWLRSKVSNMICLKVSSDIKRSERTVNTILSALSSFYRFHNQLGNTSILLTATYYLPVNRHKSLLHHIYKHRPISKKIVTLKLPKILPKTLSSEQINILLTACTNIRDRFLLSLLYETGLRIGQALALRHGDIKSWDNEIHVIFRKNNINQARNKTRKFNIVHVSQKLMRLYVEYLEACASTPNENDYVFINLLNKEALCYGAVRKIFIRLRKKTGISINPHMLRHTHATELIRHGWDAAWVQKRLGHADVSTTINIYSHLDDQDLKKAFQLYQSKVRVT